MSIEKKKNDRESMLAFFIYIYIYIYSSTFTTINMKLVSFSFYFVLLYLFIVELGYSSERGTVSEASWTKEIQLKEHTKEKEKVTTEQIELCSLEQKGTDSDDTGDDGQEEIHEDDSEESNHTKDYNIERGVRKEQDEVFVKKTAEGKKDEKTEEKNTYERKKRGRGYEFQLTQSSKEEIKGEHKADKKKRIDDYELSLLNENVEENSKTSLEMKEMERNKTSVEETRNLILTCQELFTPTIKIVNDYFLEKILLTLQKLEIMLQKEVHQLKQNLKHTAISLKKIVEEELKIIEESPDLNLKECMNLLHSLCAEPGDSPLFTITVNQILDNASKIIRIPFLSKDKIMNLYMHVEYLELHISHTNNVLHNINVIHQIFNKTMYSSIYTPFQTMNATNRYNKMEKLIIYLQQLLTMVEEAATQNTQIKDFSLIKKVLQKLSYFKKIAKNENSKAIMRLQKYLNQTHLSGSEFVGDMARSFFFTLLNKNKQTKGKLLFLLEDHVEKQNVRTEIFDLLELVNYEESLITKQASMVNDLYNTMFVENKYSELNFTQASDNTLHTKLLSKFGVHLIKFITTTKSLDFIENVENILKKITANSDLTVQSTECDAKKIILKEKREKESKREQIETSEKSEEAGAGEARKVEEAEAEAEAEEADEAAEKETRKERGEKIHIDIQKESNQLKILIGEMQQYYENVILIDRTYVSIEKIQEYLITTNSAMQTSVNIFSLIEKYTRMTGEVMNEENIQHLVSIMKQIVILTFSLYQLLNQ